MDEWMMDKWSGWRWRKTNEALNVVWLQDWNVFLSAGVGFHEVYAASKFAIEGFCESVAVQLLKFNVTLVSLSTQQQYSVASQSITNFVLS